MDSYGMPLSLGNRHTRRSLAFKKKPKKTDKVLSKKNKLPKEYWKKGKSKFSHIRLDEEGLDNINGLRR